MLYGVSQVDNAMGCLYFFGKFEWCFFGDYFGLVVVWVCKLARKMVGAK